MTTKRSANDLADLFLSVWVKLCPDLPQPEAEYRIDPGQRWRFDWAWPNEKVSVEVDGEQWSPHGGRHNTDADRWKLDEAASFGWRVLRFTAPMITTDPARCCQQVAKALGYHGA